MISTYRIAIIVLVSVAGILPVFGSTAHAMVVRGGEAYEVAADTTLEGDLYYLGKDITVYGTSTDDLFTVGSNVTLAGIVGGDVFAIGGRVDTRGMVYGDVRVAGGEIRIASSTINEDLVAIGGTVIIEKGTVIKGDVLVYSENLILDGTMEGNVEAHVQVAEIRGTVEKTTSVSARQSISVTNDAHLVGAFYYSAPREAFISDTTTIDGEKSFELLAVKDGRTGGTTLQVLIGLFISLIAALLFTLLVPRFSLTTSTVILEGGGMLALKGLVLLIAWPLIGLMLCVTIFGILPGIMLLVSYLLTVLLAVSFAPVVAGVLLVRWIKKDAIVRWDWTILGSASLAFMLYIPYIGFAVRTLLFLSAFAAFTFLLLALVRSDQKKPTDTLASGAAPAVDHTNEHDADTNNSTSTP